MRGQVTVDFMMAMGLALVMFILLLNSTYNQEVQARDVMQTVDARGLLEDFASSVDSVYLSGNNASGTFVLPDTLSGGLEYRLRVYPRSILLSFDYRGEKHYSTGIFPARINETAFVELSHCRVVIRNVGGVVYFENEE